MIVSHEHRFVFIEVPHTASHSIAEQLIRHYGGRPILRKHANYSQFMTHATREERKYFKFATVRNPLDAVTSDYWKLAENHKGQFTNPAMLLENGGHVTADHLREFRFIQEQGADFATFFRTFRCKLYNNWFLVGHQHLDQIIRFESLESDFSRLLQRLGIDQVDAIGHVNPTRAKRRPYYEFYTPDIRAQAAQCYGPFMKKWGYAFPASWGNVEVPQARILEFGVLDAVAGLSSRWITLDPDNPFLHRMKKLVDWMTSPRKMPGRTSSR